MRASYGLYFVNNLRENWVLSHLSFFVIFLFYTASYHFSSVPDSKVHGANMGPTWVPSAPDRPYVRPMNLAIRAVIMGPKQTFLHTINSELKHTPESTYILFLMIPHTQPCGIKQPAITRTSADQNLWCHTVSLGHNELQQFCIVGTASGLSISACTFLLTEYNGKIWYNIFFIYNKSISTSK